LAARLMPADSHTFLKEYPGPTNSGVSI